MNSPWAVALWFAACGAVAWTGGAVAYALSPPLTVVAFGVAGFVAGVRLSTFNSVIVGMVVTAIVGNVGSTLPLVATQAISSPVAALDFTTRAVAVCTVAYLVGAGLGFIGLARRSGAAYLNVVAGFALGGACGGALLGLSWAMSAFSIGALAMVAPWAIGGALADRAISRAQLPDEPRPWARARWPIAAALVLAAVLGGTGYWFMRSARERAALMRPLIAVDGAVMGERAALYNGLHRLSDNSARPVDEREALEIYLAVRYRDWLASDAELAEPQFKALADDIERRHADKTLDDLMRASTRLGAAYLDDLNRPYVPRRR